VIAVVPARNEAEFIGASVRSLLAAGIRVVVVDDHSADGTAEIAYATAAETGKAGWLTLMRAKPLPPGWSGKLWAMHQGVLEALSATGKLPSQRAKSRPAEDPGGAPPHLQPEFLLFTDADVVHAPESLTALLQLANSGYDLVSFMVKLQCRTWPEKLLIPAFVFFFFLLYPPAWVGDPRRRTAGAAGGCILIRPEALARAGGLEAIRNEIIDDCALARAVKRAGGRLRLCLTESSTSLRPYRSLAEIGRMIARTAFNQLRHSIWLLLGTLFGLALACLTPPALLFSASGPTAALAGAAWAAMTLAYLPLVRFYRLRPVWALSLPLSAAFYGGATVYSALLYWSGGGGRWKGRAQDAQGCPSTAGGRADDSK
jgi:hopene-associated glycosyltransferase HpnB